MLWHVTKNDYSRNQFVIKAIIHYTKYLADKITAQTITTELQRKKILSDALKETDDPRFYEDPPDPELEEKRAKKPLDNSDMKDNIEGKEREEKPDDGNQSAREGEGSSESGDGAVHRTGGEDHQPEPHPDGEVP
jgi:hypothetical protein